MSTVHQDRGHPDDSRVSQSCFKENRYPGLGNLVLFCRAP
jgi:hypothetical protein